MRRRRLKRRSFLVRSSAVLGTGCFATRSGSAKVPAVVRRTPHPVVVASANGFPHCTEMVMKELLAGKPVADAVVAGVTLVEDDPEDHSVGLGGLPNEEGIVQLDASVMDGATGLSGAVAALERIKNPAAVALRVMRYTDHCLLVGRGAHRFARAHGFPEQNLLTEEARKIWLHWRATLSDEDDWLPVDANEVPRDAEKMFDITGTINCDAVDRDGNLAGVTTTSGLAFKIPGRVGDSPLVGAGLFVDNDVGAAGSTGRGEANIVTVGSATVIEGLRYGKDPTDACLLACQRIVDTTRVTRLLRKDGKPDFNVKFYTVDKKGRFGGAALYGGGEFAVFDGKGNRKVDLAHLL